MGWGGVGCRTEGNTNARHGVQHHGRAHSHANVGRDQQSPLLHCLLLLLLLLLRLLHPKLRVKHNAKKMGKPHQNGRCKNDEPGAAAAVVAAARSRSASVYHENIRREARACARVLAAESDKGAFQKTHHK